MSGSGQTGPVGAALPLPVVVRLLAGDAGVSGVTVTFTASDGGAAQPATAVTDGAGAAQATWTLGPQAGAQALTATVAGVAEPARFTATALAAEATALAFIVGPSEPVAGQWLTPALKVEARDAHGNRAAAFAGSVLMSLTTNPGAATLGGGVTADAVAGVATFSTLTLDRPASGYVLTASASGLTPASTSPFRVTTDVVFRMVLVSGGAQFAAPGATLPAPVVVRVTDRLDNPVPNQLIAFAVTSGGGHVDPATSAYTGADGLASTTWTLGSTPGAQGLTASVGLVGLSVGATAGTPLRFASVSAGYNTTCGVTTTGAAYCWGSNSSGQLGVGSYVPATSAVPVAVQGGLSFSSISAGVYFACGVADGGAAYCWGSNTYGALLGGTTGNGTTSPVPVQGGHTFASVSSGSSHSCGLTTAGRALCWGDNSGYLLGDGTTVTSALPVAVGGPEPLEFSMVTAKASSCGVTTDAGAYCWGETFWGSLGVGGTGHQTAPTPMPLAGGGAWRQVTGGNSFSCGVQTDGSGWCWGLNQAHVLGGWVGYLTSVPVPMNGGLSWTSIDTGDGHSCGLVDGGAAYCWGDGANGKLGNGTNTNSILPTPVSGGLTFASISVADFHACAVTPEGLAYCWGASYALGDGTGQERWVPTLVSGQ
jgi:alpha-tubulin suppressor-like RCC1 family protein